MRKLLIAAAVMAGLAAPASAPAQDVGSQAQSGGLGRADMATIIAAKRAGQIGERYDGYLGFVITPSAGLRRQVDAVNIRRRALYADLAARKGVSPEEVGITTGCSLLRRISVGEFYFQGQGGWQRYAAGRSPVPSYCG